MKHEHKYKVKYLLQSQSHFTLLFRYRGIQPLVVWGLGDDERLSLSGLWKSMHKFR